MYIAAKKDLLGLSCVSRIMIIVIWMSLSWFDVEREKTGLQASYRRQQTQISQQQNTKHRNGHGELFEFALK